MMSNLKDEPLLTPHDVAEFLGVPVKTLANWRSARSGPLFLRVGAHVRYRPADVQSWLEQQAAAGRRWMAS